MKGRSTYSGEILLAAAMLLLSPTFLVAKPRPPQPPRPEGYVASWRFNGEPERAPLATVNLRGSDSWSGHALVMAGTEKTLLALGGKAKAKLVGEAGTVRLWFAPEWNSVSEGGTGPGVEVRLLEFGSWSGGNGLPAYALTIHADGGMVRLEDRRFGVVSELFRAPFGWCAGDWHQVALVWSPNATQLYLDGQLAAVGRGITLPPAAGVNDSIGFALGSDVLGGHVAQGQFEELFLFARICSSAELAADYELNAPLAALGPIPPEEDKLRQEAALAARANAPAPVPPPEFGAGGGGMAMMMGGCSSELGITRASNTITVTITNATSGLAFDLFTTAYLAGIPTTNSLWRWLARGTNGQSYVFPNCGNAFFVLGCTNDGDGDGLTDAYEVLVNKTSQTTNHSMTSALHRSADGKHFDERPGAGLRQRAELSV